MQRRSGAVALFTVSAMMIVMSIVAYAFHAMGADVRRDVHTAFLGERALSLAQSAVDEAVDDLQRRINVPPDGKDPADKVLSQVVREAKTTHVIDLTFEPKMTRKSADLAAEIQPVQIVIQRFSEGATPSTTLDAKNMPADLKERIKKGWEEYYRTGYCGPDMDLIYQSGVGVGWVALRAKVGATGDRRTVVRQLDVRRVLSHMAHNVNNVEALLREIGVRPPNNTAPGSALLIGEPTGSAPDASPSPSQSPAAPVSPSPAPSPAPSAAPAGAMPGGVSLDDIHIAPYDEVRIVTRSEEGSW